MVLHSQNQSVHLHFIYSLLTSIQVQHNNLALITYWQTYNIIERET